MDPDSEHLFPPSFDGADKSYLDEIRCCGSGSVPIWLSGSGSRSMEWKVTKINKLTWLPAGSWSGINIPGPQLLTSVSFFLNMHVVSMFAEQQYFDADPDPAFHFNADPDPAPLQNYRSLRSLLRAQHQILSFMITPFEFFNKFFFFAKVCAFCQLLKPKMKRPTKTINIFYKRVV